MHQVVGLAVLSSLYKTEKVSIVVSRPDFSDNILMLKEKKKGTIILRMQVDHSLKVSGVYYYVMVQECAFNCN